MTRININSAENYGATESEDYIKYALYNDKEFTAILWSINKQRSICEIANIKYPQDKYKIHFLFNTDGSRLLAKSSEGSRDIINLYNAISGDVIKKLTDQNKEGGDADLHSLTKKICTVSKNSFGGEVIQLWNLNDGSFVRKRNISTYAPFNVHFTDDGRYILLKKYSFIYNVVTTYDLKSAYGVKFGEMHLGNDKDKQSAPIVYWRDRNDVKLWHVSKGDPILLQNIKLGDRDSVSSSADMQRAVIWGPQRPAELWDVKK